MCRHSSGAATAADVSCAHSRGTQADPARTHRGRRRGRRELTEIHDLLSVDVTSGKKKFRFPEISGISPTCSNFFRIEFCEFIDVRRQKMKLSMRTVQIRIYFLEGKCSLALSSILQVIDLGNFQFWRRGQDHRSGVAFAAGAS